MSKASEWAEAVRNHHPLANDKDRRERMYFYSQLRRMAASVEITDGSLHLRNVFIPADEAVKLARWILDTFGEGAR